MPKPKQDTSAENAVSDENETVSNNIDTVTAAETDDIPEPKPKKGKEPKQPKAERKSKKTVKSEVDTTNQPSDFTEDYGTRRWKNRRAYTVI